MTGTHVPASPADAAPATRPDAPERAPVPRGGSRPPWASGLTEDEAARRLREEGWNELPGRDRRSFLAIAAGVMREPMFLMLVAAGAVYMLLGDLQEALMLLGFVVVVIGITLSQERKTERALDALRDLASPRALVVRGGEARRVAGREVARGDLVVLSEGDRVPADGLVADCADLAADESLLTGESVPVEKTASDVMREPARPGGDGTPYAYSGTLVVRGHGLVVVTATGAATEMGRIGGALRTITPERTALQREVTRLVQVLAIAGAVLCGVVVVGYGLGHGDWLQGVLAGLALAMALLPEEFPVILTVFLALGAWRLSRQSVLTRRVPAIEALGAATVLCVDKTGTLTENRMAVAALWAAGATLTVEADRVPAGDHAEVARAAALASLDEPFDPMERAIRSLAGRLPTAPALRPVAERPPAAGRLLMTRLWAAPDGTGVLACKGAPEAVLPLCPDANVAAADTAAAALAARGLRVLAVAGAVLEPAPDAVPDGVPLRLLGLVALADPVRRDVPAAVAACRRAGVRVVMVTGDHPGTAVAVAEQAGLRTAAGVLLGPEMDALDDADLRERLGRTDVIARVMPEQKLRIVRVLQAAGDVVAMTGDGVNDAPALRAAGIGIAMGGRGADVAREAAALVLLDDDVTSMVDAVRGGRRIVDNLRNAMTYVLAVHVPIAGLSLLPVLLGWPLVLLPVQIVFLELIIDPACSVVFEAEAEAPGIMERPPRDPAAPLISARLVGRGVAQGLCVLVVLALTLVAAHMRGTGADESRALVFAGLVVANLGLILVNRSPSRTMVATLHTGNRALWWVLGTATALLAVMLSVAPLRSLFHLGQPSPALALCGVAVGVLVVVMLETWKVLAGPRRQTAGASAR